MKRYYLTPYDTEITLTGVPVYAVDYHTSMHRECLEVVHVPHYHNAHRYVTAADSYRNHVVPHILSAVTRWGLKRLRRQIYRQFGVCSFHVIRA